MIMRPNNQHARGEDDYNEDSDYDQNNGDDEHSNGGSSEDNHK